MNFVVFLNKKNSLEWFQLQC